MMKIWLELVKEMGLLMPLHSGTFELRIYEMPNSRWVITFYVASSGQNVPWIFLPRHKS